MLVKLHNWARGWIASVLIMGIIVVFVFWGVSSYIAGEQDAAAVAKVNGVKITFQEFSQTVQLLQRQHEVFAEQPKLSDNDISDQALQALILEQALLTTARAHGYFINKQEVHDWLLRAPQFQDNGIFSREKFAQVANQLQLSQTVLMQKIADSLLLEQLPRGLYASHFLFESEVEQLYRLLQQKRDIDYLVISAQENATREQPSEEKQRRYYDSHRSDFMQPEQAKMDYVLYSLTDAENQVAVTQDDIAEYYAEHRSEYRLPPSWHVAHILLSDDSDGQKVLQTVLQRLQQGEDFQALAKQYSQDIRSAPQGGNLGWVVPGELPKSVESALMKLDDGAISAPVTSSYGVHLLHRLQFKPSQAIPLVDARVDIEQRLIAHRAAELYSQTREELATFAYENPDSLDGLANHFGLTVLHHDFTTRSGSSAGVTRHPKVLQSLFSDEVLLDGNNSDALALDDKTTLVLRAVEHQASQPRPFSEVQQQIVSILQQQMASQKAKKQGEAILSELQGQGNAQKLAVMAGLKWHQKLSINRSSKEVPAALLHHVFQLPPPQNKEPVYSGLKALNGNYYVIVLRAVHDAVVGDNDSQLPKFAAQLTQVATGIEYDLYRQAVIEAAAVKKYNSVLAR